MGAALQLRVAGLQLQFGQIQRAVLPAALRLGAADIELLPVFARIGSSVVQIQRKGDGGRAGRRIFFGCGKGRSRLAGADIPLHAAAGKGAVQQG